MKPKLTLPTLIAEAGDYTTTLRLREMVQDGANEEDIMGYLSDLFLSNSEQEARSLSKNILKNQPLIGCFKKSAIYELMLMPQIHFY